MYSFIVGACDGRIHSSRMLESTSEEIRDRLGSNYFQKLKEIPALVMPEPCDTESEQIARVGRIASLEKIGIDIKFNFEPKPSIAPIPIETIERLANKFGIQSDHWGLNRTRWSVKNVDLYEVIVEHIYHTGALDGQGASNTIRFPTDKPRNQSLVAVMMPFSKKFDAVYEVIQDAVAGENLHCQRVDDIWEDEHIMNDIASLLWRAEIVIADLTGRNSNVFYEVGLAHALSRKTVLLTQSNEDVPFDLQSIRYLKYDINEIRSAEGFALRHSLSKRLRSLRHEKRQS